MCDYSLMGIPNRLPKEGETLVTYRFRTGAIGLAATADLRSSRIEVPSGNPSYWARIRNWVFVDAKQRDIPAVCVPPGASMKLLCVSDKVSDLASPGEPVTFTQITAKAYQFRDAMRFSNGKEVLLQTIGEGLQVRLVDLSSSESTLPAETQLAAGRRS